jgi:hypothetical protein
MYKFSYTLITTHYHNHVNTLFSQPVKSRMKNREMVLAMGHKIALLMKKCLQEYIECTVEGMTRLVCNT